MSHPQARRATPASGGVEVAGGSGDIRHGRPVDHLHPGGSEPARRPDAPYAADNGYRSEPGERSGELHRSGPGYVATARGRSSDGRSSDGRSSDGRSGAVYGRSPQGADDPVTGSRPSGAQATATAATAMSGRGPAGAAGGSRRDGGPPRPPARKRTRRRDPIWARLLVLFGALLMLASGGTIVGAKALLFKATSAVERAPLLGGAGAATGARVLEGPLNILMVGIDERPDGEELIRADSILILHVPASHDAAYLMSVPRDTLVDIPPYAKTNFRGSREKINGAFAAGSAHGGGREGGFELLALTLQTLTGLSFNAGAIVDFAGFEAVVKALGGVDMCVDTRIPVKSEHVGFDRNGKYKHPRDGGKPMVYNPGECRRFKPWEALDYVRQRKTLEDGDYGRQRHQQQFVKALAAEAKKQNLATNPAKLIKIMEAAGKALTVDLRGAGLESWLFTVRNVADSDVMMLKANGGSFNTVRCGGEDCEVLNQATFNLFAAMRDDTMSQFILAHPEFVNR